jgi:hypothetical protein
MGGLIMFGNLRNKMPSMDEAADIAKDNVMRVANQTVASARDVGGHIDEWAKDGYDAVKARPLMWGAASLGFGALMGGLYALWQREAKRGVRPKRKTMATRSRTKHAVRTGTRKLRAVRKAAVSE